MLTRSRLQSDCWARSFSADRDVVSVHFVAITDRAEANPRLRNRIVSGLNRRKHILHTSRHDYRSRRDRTTVERSDKPRPLAGQPLDTTRLYQCTILSRLLSQTHEQLLSRNARRKPGVIVRARNHPCTTMAAIGDQHSPMEAAEIDRSG